MYTREDLDKAWSELPYGQFTKLVKDQKGKRPYKIITVLEKVTTEEIDRVETIAWCKPGSDRDFELVHNKNKHKTRGSIGGGSYRWKRIVENV